MTIFNKTLLMIALLVLSLFSMAHEAAQDSPVGTWEARSKKNKDHKSYIRIYEVEGKLKGDIVDIFPEEKKQDLCVNCKGDEHNKPLLGMTILSGFEAQGANTWGGGKIVDPENGKVYNAFLTVTDSGHHLDVRGYIGAKMFGATDTWYRVK